MAAAATTSKKAGRSRARPSKPRGFGGAPTGKHNYGSSILAPSPDGTPTEEQKAIVEKVTQRRNTVIQDIALKKLHRPPPEDMRGSYTEYIDTTATSSSSAPAEAAAKQGGGKPAKPLSGSEVNKVESAVEKALNRFGKEMVAGLRDKGWWASEGPVLMPNLREALREECEALWRDDVFQRSQSVRGTQYYDKENVYATEIDSSKYHTSPRMVHYTVAVTRALSELIREEFPETDLSPKYIGNKLNMCVGNGASFDAHLDTGVAEKPFNRKLTLLLYLNKSWRPALGGRLKLLGEEGGSLAGTGLPTDVEPTAGRWVAFWSDKMLHGVEPSQAPGGLSDYRLSYTIWLCSHDDSQRAPPAPPTAVTSKVPGNSSGAFEEPPPFAMGGL